MRTVLLPLLMAFALGAATAASAQSHARLSVSVEGVRNDSGSVRCGLYASANGFREPGREMRPLSVDPFSRREAGISCVVEAGRRVREYAAFDALEESVMVEVVDRAGDRSLIRNHLRYERFPTQPIVRGQSRPDFPVVRDVKVKSLFVNLEFVRSALLESKNFSKHEVAHAQTCLRAVERE